MRMSEGDSLTFTVDDIPMSMDYDIIVRYEPQVSAAIHLIDFEQGEISVYRILSNRTALPVEPPPAIFPSDRGHF